LIEAETQMILMDQNMSMMVEENIPSILQIEEENSIESEEKDKEFLGKLKDMKRSQVKQQKKSYGSCHRCDFYHEKAVFHRCNICKNEICYLCVMDLSNKMEKDFKSKKDFTELLRNLECIVCKKSCKCAVCKNKGKHEESADAVPVTKIL
jgi:ABC-type lipopolysaccharide export system ATPase subunit